MLDGDKVVVSFFWVSRLGYHILNNLNVQLGHEA